jgi:hypothetical protein
VRALFDVNALLALFDRDHVFHTPVRAWWAANEGSGWATCPITQNGFARIMSQPGYPRNRPTVEAIKALHAGVVQPGHQFWPDDISIADADVFDRTRILGPKQLTDVYLLALAVKNGGRLVTLDRAVPISAVHGAEPHHIAVL